MSGFWPFRYSSFMFADSFLDSLFPGSLNDLVIPFTYVSFEKNHNFYLVLTVCHLSPKNSYWGMLILRCIQHWKNLLLVFTFSSITDEGQKDIDPFSPRASIPTWNPVWQNWCKTLLVPCSSSVWPPFRTRSPGVILLFPVPCSFCREGFRNEGLAYRNSWVILSPIFKPEKLF